MQVLLRNIVNSREKYICILRNIISWTRNTCKIVGCVPLDNLHDDLAADGVTNENYPEIRQE
jgi:hypothetical protein